jgi:hypothetical protein
LLSYAVSFLTEELDHVTKSDGEIVKTVYGVERIPDPMLLKEMQAYRDGLNVDRLVSFAALVAFSKIQHSNRGYARKTEYENANLENSPKISNLKMSPFRHIGGSKNVSISSGKPRNPFKNFR